MSDRLFSLTVKEIINFYLVIAAIILQSKIYK